MCPSTEGPQAESDEAAARVQDLLLSGVARNLESLAGITKWLGITNLVMLLSVLATFYSSQGKEEVKLLGINLPIHLALYAFGLVHLFVPVVFSERVNYIGLLARRVDFSRVRELVEVFAITPWFMSPFNYVARDSLGRHLFGNISLILNWSMGVVALALLRPVSHTAGFLVVAVLSVLVVTYAGVSVNLVGRAINKRLGEVDADHAKAIHRYIRLGVVFCVVCPVLSGLLFWVAGGWVG